METLSAELCFPRVPLKFDTSLSEQCSLSHSRVRESLQGGMALCLDEPDYQWKAGPIGIDDADPSCLQEAHEIAEAG